MTERLDVTNDLIYDLISVQYHALQAVDSYRKYVDDADNHHPDAVGFFERCLEQDLERARTCHELLARLTEKP